MRHGHGLAVGIYADGDDLGTDAQNDLTGDAGLPPGMAHGQSGQHHRQNETGEEDGPQR